MNMKRKLCVLLLFAACLLRTATAEVMGISILGMADVPGTPSLYMQVRAIDGAGVGMRTEREAFAFSAADISLTTSVVPGGNKGHIIVVDTSLYYYGSKNIKADDVREIVDAYLARLSSDERVMFVLASEASRPTCTNYMTLSEAREYAAGIALGQSNSARINTAIYEAFNYAISPAQGAPAFNAVFIVADPDLASNEDREHTLDECVKMRAASNKSFDVAVANIYRASFLEDTSKERRDALNNGFAQYQSFALNCGGKYMQIPQDKNGVDTDNVHMELASWLYTTHEFVVDFSAISGYVPTEPQEQEIALAIACGGATRTVALTLDTTLLPEPDFTPEPTPEAPTPTPAPTPMVAVGQADAVAMQAIHALLQMNYLDKGRDEFDNECFLAYIDFCQNNGIDPRDGIYEETYELMLSGEAKAAAVTTPEPTATPEPTIPPEGYSINDQDTEDSGGYIAAMQAVLKSLNCYADGATANVGRLDQATVDAANRYCEAYNWRNDHPSGVSQQIVSEILTNGSKLNPITTPEPTMRDKAKAFLSGSVQVAQVTVPNGLLLAVCLGLVVVIVVIIILRTSGSKRDRFTPGPTPTPSPAPGSSSAPKGTSAPAQDDMPTTDPYNKKEIRLQIQFGAGERSEVITLREGVPFTIGREAKDASKPDLCLDAADRSVSRGQHAVLLYKNGQVYISDASKYHNTLLNGIAVHDREGKDGLPMGSGDKLTISSHVIQVNW